MADQLRGKSRSSPRSWTVPKLACSRSPGRTECRSTAPAPLERLNAEIKRRTDVVGILPNEPPAFQSWITDPERLKPGVHMPRFGMLPDSDLRALAAYLEGLQ